MENIIKKIDWDVYFMSQTFLISQKSIDPSTKHGAVWVSNCNKVLSVGYNGPLSNVDDEKIPLFRPNKYFHFLHAEENCLLSYEGSTAGTIDSKMYITGRPCYKCLRMILQKGIKKIIYGKVKSFCMDFDDLESQELMLSLKPSVEMIEFDRMNEVIDLLNKSIEYINLKCVQQ